MIKPHINGNKIVKSRFPIAVKIVEYFPSKIRIKAPDIPGRIIAVADRTPVTKMIIKLSGNVTWPKRRRLNPRLKPPAIKIKLIIEQRKLSFEIE